MSMLRTFPSSLKVWSSGRGQVASERKQMREPVSPRDQMIARTNAIALPYSRYDQLATAANFNNLLYLPPSYESTSNWARRSARSWGYFWAMVVHNTCEEPEGGECQGVESNLRFDFLFSHGWYLSCLHCGSALGSIHILFRVKTQEPGTATTSSSQTTCWC